MPSRRRCGAVTVYVSLAATLPVSRSDAVRLLGQLRLAGHVGRVCLQRLPRRRLRLAGALSHSACGGRQFRRVGFQLPLRRGDRPRRAGSTSAACSGVGHRHPRLAPADRRLLHVREERRHAVEVARRERVELVVVALAAAHRRRHPDRRDVPHPVGRVLRLVLLRPAPRPPRSSAAAGCTPLATFWLGRRRSGSRSPASCSIVNWSNGLLALKASMTQSRYGETFMRVVAVVADGVGVAHQVQPVHGHALAVVRAGQQAVHLLFVGVGRRVGHERRDLRRRRRQAGQVEADAAAAASPGRPRAAGAGRSPSAWPG